MVVRITSISLGITLILLTFSATASLASYCGPDPGCAPPLKVNVRGPGMPYGGPAMAGPRPMYRRARLPTALSAAVVRSTGVPSSLSAAVVRAAGLSSTYVQPEGML